ncbi:MAG TPA: YaiI/YqxD family protein [Desulfuromonadales bacterium]|nr:YaiI/YqxD family protein [Desulfuromonadales bacterium]
MQIWIDADACPRAIKDILYRAAVRRKVSLTLVANKAMQTPPSPYIQSIKVSAGFDVADQYIVDQLEPDDLVITADIPLAADVLAKGGYVLDPRGERLTEENIGERLAIRDALDELRGVGVDTGGPATFNASDRQAFANQLDRFLTRHLGA